jgi:hypothetical protein
VIVKNTYFLLLSIWCLNGYSQIKFSIQGKIEGLDSGIITLDYIDQGQPRSDTTSLINGTFSFSNSISEPILATLKIKDRLILNFFLDNGPTTISLTRSGVSKIEGGSSQREYQAFMASVREVLPIIKETYRAYWNLDAGRGRDSLYDLYLSLQKELKKRISNFISQNSHSVIGAWAVADNYYNATSDEIKVLYDRFTPEVKKSYYGKETEELYKVTAKSAIGKKLKTFTAQDPDGRLVAFPDLKASYILVIFGPAGVCHVARKTLT